MKIGIVGSRRRNKWVDWLATRNKFFEIYKFGDTIVSGGCPKGGDLFAERLAAEHKIPIRVYRPHWHEFGKAAGILRNTYIAKDSDVLLAVVADDRKGGTEDTIRKFSKFHPDAPIHLI